MFGGMSATNTPLTDTWEWDGTDWHDVTPTGDSPPTSATYPCAYDPLRGVVVMLSGSTVWEWNGTAWAGFDVPDIAPTGKPGVMNPFIMCEEGVARLWTRGLMRDGPFPVHYEPFESPVANPIAPKVRGNPVARVFRGGAVIDFMILGIGPVRTGVFNIADLCLTTGAIHPTTPVVYAAASVERAVSRDDVVLQRPEDVRVNVPVAPVRARPLRERQPAPAARCSTYVRRPEPGRTWPHTTACEPARGWWTPGATESVGMRSVFDDRSTTLSSPNE